MANEVYYIYIILFSLTLIYLLSPENRSPYQALSEKLPYDSAFAWVSGLTVVGLIGLSLLFYGNPLNYETKRAYVDSIGFLVQLSNTALIIFSVYVFSRHSPTYLKCIAAILILFVLLTGKRDVLVIAAIAVIVLCYGRHSLKLRHFLGFLALGIIAVIFVSAAKPLYGAARAGQLAVSSYTDFVMRGAEFMSQLSLINQIVKYDFVYSIGSYASSLLSLLPIPTSAFGISSGHFNEVMQPVLFPGREGGVAYSPWGEAFAVGGYLGVFLFATCVLLFLWLLERGAGRSVLAAILVAYVAFYIERNSLGTTLAFIRNVFYPFISIYAVRWTLLRASNS